MPRHNPPALSPPKAIRVRAIQHYGNAGIGAELTGTHGQRAQPVPISPARAAIAAGIRNIGLTEPSSPKNGIGAGFPYLKNCDSKAVVRQYAALESAHPE